MLDIGWPELFLIAVVTIIVVGPAELPRVVRAVSGLVRKIRFLASEFQSTLDDMAREADLEDIRQEIEPVSKVDVTSELKDAIDPSRTMDGALDFDDPKTQGSSRLLEPQAEATGVGDRFVGDINEHSKKMDSPNLGYVSAEPSGGPSKTMDAGKAPEDAVSESSSSK